MPDPRVHYCVSCDRPCVSYAAAEECARLDDAEDRENRIRRNTN